jgi:hypothetical protein
VTKKGYAVPTKEATFPPEESPEGPTPGGNAMREKNPVGILGRNSGILGTQYRIKSAIEKQGYGSRFERTGIFEGGVPGFD